MNFCPPVRPPKVGPGWERLSSLAPPREAKQNNVQFLLGEFFARARPKEKENIVLLCVAVRRAEPRGGSAAPQARHWSASGIFDKVGSSEVI